MTSLSNNNNSNTSTFTSEITNNNNNNNTNQEQVSFNDLQQQVLKDLIENNIDAVVATTTTTVSANNEESNTTTLPSASASNFDLMGMSSGVDLCGSPSTTVSFINHELDSDEHFKTSLFTIFSFPKNVPFKRVAAEIFKMGYESTFTQLLCVASITVLMMTVGKVLDLENYAAVGIGFSVFNIFCVAPTIGFASALDTLATAAYGRSPTGTEVGQLTQLGVGFGFLFTIPMCFFFLLGSDIFVAVVFGENYVAGACEFLRYIIPAALIYAPMTVIQKSLQAQLLSRPPMLATFFATISTAVGCFTLVPWFGIRGVALTLACTYGAQLVAMLFFAPADALYKKVSWIETFLTSKQQFFKVFSKANVSSYCAVGFTSMFAICCPWYIWELILVVAARMGETEVAYFNIFMNLVNLCWCFSAGFATCASGFVGKALGSGKGNLALAYARSTWVLSQVNMWFIISIYLVFNRQLAFFYTSEESVVNMLSKNLALVCLSMATDDLQFVGFAIFRGCGKQKEAPLTVFCSWGIFGIPVGCLLAFYFNMGATGLMLGLALGDVIKIAIQIARVHAGWNWEQMAVEAGAHNIIETAMEKQIKSNNISQSAIIINVENIENNSNNDEQFAVVTVIEKESAHHHHQQHLEEKEDEFIEMIEPEKVLHQSFSNKHNPSSPSRTGSNAIEDFVAAEVVIHVDEKKDLLIHVQQNQQLNDEEAPVIVSRTNSSVILTTVTPPSSSATFYNSQIPTNVTNTNHLFGFIPSASPATTIEKVEDQPYVPLPLPTLPSLSSAARRNSTASSSASASSSAMPSPTSASSTSNNITNNHGSITLKSRSATNLDDQQDKQFY